MIGVYPAILTDLVGAGVAPLAAGPTLAGPMTVAL